ncbi:MAG: hybrid sensor histidine kinase/response regulator, partial [Panacagrimonas sp.]
PVIFGSKVAVFFQLSRQQLQMAEDLRERTETLRLSEMFVAILGHDLRTPLSTILTSTELLRRSADPDTVAQIAERIRSGARHMQTLVENVLDLARARLAGGIPLNRDEVDLGTLIRSSVQGHQAVAPQVRFDVSTAGELRGDWDADRLMQVLSNLLGNALQHGEKGKPVEIMADGTRPEWVSVTVSNAGRIPPEALPHVFDPFAAARRQRARNEGLGLGLYIVRQIVGAHSGEIGVHVEDETRTVFRITLPRGGKMRPRSPGSAATDAAESAAPTPAPTPAMTPVPVASALSRRILVVDDNRDSADSLAILLELDGNQIRTAYDGLEAIEVAADFRPDVILLDLGLPRLDGYQAAQRIRSETWGEKMVLVALTGWDHDDDRRRTSEAGFDRHLVKPVDSGALLKILSDLPERTL